LIYINFICFMIVELYVVYIVRDINIFTNIGYWFDFVIIIVNIKKSNFIWNKFNKKLLKNSISIL
jgi:hypothetical protein